MVRGSVAIALGIICIILAISLDAGFFGYYTMLLNNKSKEYDDYARNHSVFNSEYSWQLSQNTNLQAWLNGNITAYNSYVNDHSYTNEQYQNLQANYNNLMNDYQQALAKIPSDKGITIDSINWTQGSGVTGVVVRNLGVNATTVITLKLYWTTEGVLASSGGVTVVIPGKSSASIQIFLPINGWNTVYDTWTLKVATLEGYNATSDPLMIIL